jgi:hypothetical protein
MKAVTAQALF